ncbi:MAG: hypothetical protein PHD97_01650 [Bacteroidales bacterium]|nr:hypothetical protein [Bacteroidales bacterium]
MALTAYNMKTKKKNVPFSGTPEIMKTKNKRYLVQGKDKDGNKMASAISEANALAAIKNKEAKKGW